MGVETMGNGWNDLVRIPFFGFLPNFFLGVCLLYVLKWTGVITCWNQLFDPIYHMGPAEMIPSWLVAFFILTVVFGLGWGVSSVGDFFTTLPLKIEMTAEEYRKHTYFFDYPSQEDIEKGKVKYKYPTTIRYTPFRKTPIHYGVLWHIFKGEHTVSEMAEKAFAITGRLNSGMFVLALMYGLLEMVRIIRNGDLFVFILTVAIVFVISIVTYHLTKEECKQLKLDMISEDSTLEIAGRSRELLFYLLVCPIVGWLVAFAGLGWLIAYANKPPMWEPAFRILFALALAIWFYREAIRDRIHANALDYTHYLKVLEEKEEEARKKQDEQNQNSKSSEDVQR